MTCAQGFVVRRRTRPLSRKLSRRSKLRAQFCTEVGLQSDWELHEPTRRGRRCGAPAGRLSIHPGARKAGSKATAEICRVTRAGWSLVGPEHPTTEVARSIIAASFSREHLRFRGLKLLVGKHALRLQKAELRERVDQGGGGGGGGGLVRRWRGCRSRWRRRRADRRAQRGHKSSNGRLDG